MKVNVNFVKKHPTSWLFLNESFSSVYQFLPGLTPDGTSVIYVKLMDKNPSNFNYVEQVKLFLMVYDLYLMQEGLTEGHTILFDMEGGTLTHLAKCGIMTVKKIMYYLQVSGKWSVGENRCISCLSGSPACSQKRSSFHQRRSFHGQGPCLDEAFHEERTNGNGKFSAEHDNATSVRISDRKVGLFSRFS